MSAGITQISNSLELGCVVNLYSLFGGMAKIVCLYPSMLPIGIAPMWGIDLNVSSTSQHASFDVYRDRPDNAWDVFLDMPLGHDLSNWFFGRSRHYGAIFKIMSQWHPARKVLPGTDWSERFKSVPIA